MSAQHWSTRAAELAGRASLHVAAAGLLAMTLVIAWQVFARFVLNDSPSWAEPLALLLMLYFVLLAAAVGVREGFHLGLTILVQALPARARALTEIAASLLVCAFGVLMAVNGSRLVEYTSGHVIPGLGVSRAFAYVPFAAAGVLIALFALERSARLAPASRVRR
jgi:TRAP-type C4-dicarboxylate transport system permease small subunit